MQHPVVLFLSSEAVSSATSRQWASPLQTHSDWRTFLTQQQAQAIENSNDGNFVAFVSDATNLVTGDTTLISVGLGGFSDSVALSGDGHFVVFDSKASNLVAGDTNGVSDIFVRDTVAGTTRRVSVASWGIQGISDNGRFVVFQTDSTNRDGSDALKNVCKRVSWGPGEAHKTDRSDHGYGQLSGGGGEELGRVALSSMTRWWCWSK